MSLLIKDMEMPTVGRILIIFPSGRTLEVSADNTQNIFREAKAVPVPSHGRLIDADALTVEMIAEQLGGYTGRSWRVVTQIIEDAPTIIEAEPAAERRRMARKEPGERR